MRNSKNLRENSTAQQLTTQLQKRHCSSLHRAPDKKAKTEQDPQLLTYQHTSGNLPTGNGVAILKHKL